jgi:type II secretory pathway component GspD/PulD (secretin)
MKTENIFALIVVVLAPCLAAVAQTPATPTAPAPTAPAPAVTPPSGPGDILAKPPEAAVVAHGTGTEQPAVQVVSLTNELGDEILDLVTFDGIPLPDAVRALALQAGLNIQFDPRLLNTVGPDGRSIPITPPTITEKWKKVTAKQALTSLLDNWGWQLVMDPRSPIGRITAKDPTALEPLVTAVIQLEYSNPTNILTEVQPTLSPRSSIISDSRTHKLIIRTTERELPGVEALITRLDTSTRQVLIEAKIVETTKDINSAKGVDWTGTLAAQHVSFGNGLTSGTIGASNMSYTSPVVAGTTTLPGGTTIATSSGGGLVSTTTNLSALTTTILGSPSQGGGISMNTAHGFSPSTAFLSADGVSAVLAFLNTDADTRSLSLPRTVALDGVQTEIMSVQNIPIFEQQQSSAAVGAAPLATVLPNYDKKVEGTVLNEVGVKLTVIPRIAGPTNILMDLRPEISSVDAQVASDTLDGQVSTSPIFDRRRITTQAAVPSGYTLVLGGVEIDNTLNSATKVPVLGDLPGLGNLFRSNSKTHNKDNLLIFVTPTIIRDSDFHPGNTQFLKRKDIPPSNVEEGPWNSAKPYDWTKPNTTVTPSYQP